MSTREELTRQAEKCLRQGRLDEAIAQYQELAGLEPVDWGLVKQLADLLERAGQREGAARQFARWADHLFSEGFHSKSAALYKKVLKLEPADEHALWQLGEVSLELKLRADARLAFQRVAELRQRRGDAAGAAAARDRLSSFEISPTGASAASPTPPAYLSTVPSSAPSPAAAPATPPEPFAAPSEMPGARLERLRREAEDADDLGRPDADDAWQAVLDIDPDDVAVRLRLVQAACDRGAFERASDLAASLDATEDPALVVLIELAHQRGRTNDIDRLIAGRLQAGAGREHLLAPVEALAERQPGAARAALASAVAAWAAAGQPEDAVAALEHGHARGLLTTALYLQWVDICVDADLPSLSQAQHALAGAYLSDHRLHEARAVAEDLFVRDGGAEPSRSLLLEILAREGVRQPDRVLAYLLTAPSESADDAVAEDAEVDAIPSEVVDPPGSDLPPWMTPPVTAAVGKVEVAIVAASAVAATEVASLPPAASAADEPRRGGRGLTAPASAVFDWSDLLGRDVDGAGVTADIAPLPSSVAVPGALLHESGESNSDEPPPRAQEEAFLFPVASARPPTTGSEDLADADPPRPVPEAGHVAAEQASGESPDPPDPPDPGSDLPESDSEAVGVIEEEIDLTQLLEELKQWDPLLPEPLVRPPDAPEEKPDTDDGTPQPDDPGEDPVVCAGAGGMAPQPEAPAPGDAALLDETLPSDSLPSEGSAELDAVFADLYRHTDDRAVAEQQLAAGRVFLAAGLVAEAARAFERASLAPRSRFDAALALAELHRSRGQAVEAVGWYEQATTAAVPDAAVKRAVLYDLAESLEALGENDRALGVLLDLLSQVEDYRDARARLDRLLRVDAGG